MNYLVVLVLDNPDSCPNILDAWEKVGAKGITILESTGIGRVRLSGLRDDFPLIPSLSDLLKSGESHNRTLFSVVDDLDAAHLLVSSAQNVIGDFEKSNTGLLFVAPLVEVHGLSKRSPL